MDALGKQPVIKLLDLALEHLPREIKQWFGQLA